MLVLSSRAADINVFNDFATGLGTWNTTALLQDNGFNLGYQTTGWTGGDPGYIGGLGIRTNSPVGASGMPRILDTQSFIGQPVDLRNTTFSASGKMFLEDLNSSGDLNLGFFNTANPGGERLVLRIHSPSNPGQWRFRFGDGNGSGTRVTVPDNTWNAATLDFSFTFTPSGVNDGAGLLTGTVSLGATDLNLVPRSVSANAWTIDSFGVWWDSASSVDELAQQNTFFDDMTFTVIPEPSVAMLLPLGAGILLLVRRKLLRTK